MLPCEKAVLPTIERQCCPVLASWLTCVIADVGCFRPQGLIVLSLDIRVRPFHGWLDHGIQGNSNLKASAKAPAHIP
jgi:hypothetical protein